MPVTISYDLAGADSVHHNYIRSMLERFGWRRFGGSVFRYDAGAATTPAAEDWLNNVIPSLMLLRAYILHNGLALKRFTLDAASTTFVDLSDPAQPLGQGPQGGIGVTLVQPTNQQSSETALRDFVDACTTASP